MKIDNQVIEVYMNPGLNLWLSNLLERSAQLRYSELNLQDYRAFLKSVSRYKNLNDIYLHIARLRKPSFFVLHHDILAHPEQIRQIAGIEQSLGWRSTFFIRPQAKSLDMEIAWEIWNSSHDLGLLYDCLDCAHQERKKGYLMSVPDRAWMKFQNSLSDLRRFKIKVCACLNRPLGVDNRLLWKAHDYRSMDLRCDADMDLLEQETVYFKVFGRRVDYLMRDTSGSFRKIDTKAKIKGIKDLGVRLKNGRMVDRIVVRMKWW